MRSILLILLLLIAGCAQVHHPTVEERRSRTCIIAHRGSHEFAHENTLEAYRATFELGGDGNEIDIRRSTDGVLYCFHDDMLDHLVQAYGRPEEYAWADLNGFSFRNPGSFEDHCRMPTLREVLTLHKKYGGLLHLDIKQQAIDADIARLLTEMNMWDHVAYCHNELGKEIVNDKRYRPRRYKTGLYEDHSEVFPDAIAAVLKKEGDDVIVDDPRGAAVLLGRKLGPLSRRPVSKERGPGKPSPRQSRLFLCMMLPTLRDAADWSQWQTPQNDRDHRIVARAHAAAELKRFAPLTLDTVEVLSERVQQRSLHKDWLYHGLDGEAALRTLILTASPGAVDLSRSIIWRDDPALVPLLNPQYNTPASWVDWRIKSAVFPALRHRLQPGAEQLCRDYLALSDEEARRIGPPLFEEAGRALLAISPTRETAIELMKHRLQVVRGRALLDCLRRSNEPWALDALKESAPHALAYQVRYP